MWYIWRCRIWFLTIFAILLRFMVSKVPKRVLRLVCSDMSWLSDSVTNSTCGTCYAVVLLIVYFPDRIIIIISIWLWTLMIRNLQLVELSWQYERNVSVRSADLLGNLRLALEYLPISSTSICTASGLHRGVCPVVLPGWHFTYLWLNLGLIRVLA
jgi:hypothetical protein